jgi:hypothetical protein
MDQLVIAITESRDQDRPLSLHEIYAMIDQNSDIQIRSDTLYHALLRDGRNTPVRGIPLEENRLKVTADQIRFYFEMSSVAINNVPASFIFNMDNQMI